MLHRLDDSLLRGVLHFLTTDDVYRLWLFAEEHDVEVLRDCLAVDLGGSDRIAQRERAKHMAAAYACWTALLKLTKRSHLQHVLLSPRTVESILDELQNLGVSLAPHPDRQRAMLVVARRYSLPTHVMYAAARIGNIESVVWLHHVTRYDLAEALSVAGRNGHVELVSWLLNRANSCGIAGAGGHTVKALFSLLDDPALGVAAWCVKKTNTDTDQHFALTTRWGFGAQSLRSKIYPVIDMAAGHGDLEGVRQLFLHPVFKDAFTVEAFESAAGMGHLDVLKVIYEHWRDEFEEDRCLHVAAIKGRLEVAQWLAANNIGGVLRHQTYQQVIRNGHLNILQWMVNSFPTSAAIHMDNSKVAVAARAGHSHIVKWLIEEEGYEVIRYHLSQAAGGGHLDLVQWILQYPRKRPDGSIEHLFVDQTVLNMAAKSGSYALVRWLVEDQGAWSPDALQFALKSSNVDTIVYLHRMGENRAQTFEQSAAQVNTREWICKNDYERLECLLRLGYTRGILNKNHFDRLKAAEREFSFVERCLGWQSSLSNPGLSKDRSDFAMTKLRKVVRQIIEVYDSSFLRAIAWLPQWAVEHGTLSTLRRLAEVQHPKIFTPEIFKRLLRVSADEQKVRWFLTERPFLCAPRVVQWAVKLKKHVFTKWFFEVFLADRQDAELHRRCVCTAERATVKYRQW